jgi:inner membrane transporter RhtA
MSLRTRPPSDSALLPIAVLIAAMICFQTGAALAKTLIPVVGASGAVALRLAFATLMLWLVWRPWRMRLRAPAARTLVMYGIALGCMNLLFYSALQRIPLGIAVALEFTGPLAIAMASSNRPLDFLWIALAALGLLMLLPLGAASQVLDPVGIACALGAGVCWALYIVFGRRAGIQHGGQTTAIGMLIGAIVIVPFGVAHAGSRLLSPAILPAALGVALLSSALPYSLEMFAMTRLPTRTFGVLLSLDPALGALSGLGFLGERLTWLQWAAIGSIVLASAGSAATSRSTPAPTPLPE